MKQYIKRANLNIADALLIPCVVVIVFFVNTYSIGQYMFELAYFMSVYCIVLLCFYLVWTAYDSVITRSLMITLLVYFTFALIVKSVRVIDYDLYKLIYKGKYINYILSIGCGWALLVYPLVLYIKKRIKK